MAGGRPRKFKSPAQFESACAAYFEAREADGAPMHIPGLCRHLGITKQNLYEYGDREEFSDSVKKARERCEEYVVEQSMLGNIPPAVGIFLLKNFGYTDAVQLEHSGKVGYVVEIPAKSEDADAWSKEHETKGDGE